MFSSVVDSPTDLFPPPGEPPELKMGLWGTGSNFMGTEGPSYPRNAAPACQLSPADLQQLVRLRWALDSVLKRVEITGREEEQPY